jgi:hypothetical protein
MERQAYVHAEEPLIAEAWRSLMAENPARARRRYCHQVKLAGDDRPDLLRSIHSFQDLTRREPEQFLPLAFIRARQYLERRAIDTPEQRAAWFEDQICGGELPPGDRYAEFAGPAHLFAAVMLSLRMLEQQAEDLGPEQLFRVPPPSEANNSASIWEPEQRQVPDPAIEARVGLQRAWRQVVYKLAIVLEELYIPDPPVGLGYPGQLAPYPDAEEWRALLVRDPAGARRYWRELDLLQSAAGIAVAFNLGESLAAFQIANEQLSDALSAA